jgi:hypothetical protein
MKINEVLQEGNIKNFRDPDHEPGAMDREAKARQGADERAAISIKNLNAIAKKYKLKTEFEYGQYSGVVGDFIKCRTAKGTKLKTADGEHEVELSSSGTSQELKLYVSGVENFTGAKSDEFKAKLKTLSSAPYNVAVRYEANHKSLTVQFGYAYRYYDKKEMDELKKMFALVTSTSFV